ncbi:hypothetical protein ACU20_08820 [Actinobaculum suis]|nr:hypothetical protein ACU20_08820 [Actinobaculum suis]
MLPEVLGPEEVAGFVSEEAANQLGIRAGIVVGPGGGDQHLAAAGIGLRPRDVCFSLGTSGVVFTISEVPIADVTGMVDGVASATGTWQPLVCTQNFTQVTDLFAKLMGIDVAELGELALQADRSRERPVLAPYLGGERSPNYPHGTGILTGISYGMDRSQLALVLIEGILLGLVRGLREINRQNVDTSGRVIAIGGAASSPGIVQILADLLERPINILDSPEATVRGACLQALAVLRGATFSQLCDEYAPQLGKLVTPREGPTWPNLYSEYMHTADLAGTWGK